MHYVTRSRTGVEIPGIRHGSSFTSCFPSGFAAAWIRASRSRGNAANPHSHANHPVIILHADGRPHIPVATTPAGSVPHCPHAPPHTTTHRQGSAAAQCHRHIPGSSAIAVAGTAARHIPGSCRTPIRRLPGSARRVGQADRAISLFPRAAPAGSSTPATGASRHQGAGLLRIFRMTRPNSGGGVCCCNK